MTRPLSAPQRVVLTAMQDGAMLHYGYGRQRESESYWFGSDDESGTVTVNARVVRSLAEMRLIRRLVTTYTLTDAGRAACAQGAIR